ncbi:MAG: response regulator transcription factor [Solirubrobacterales bacterium]
MSDPVIDIVLADDHTVVRSGLRLVLESEADLEVVAEAEDVDATVRKVMGYKPSVLVLDINMGGRSSLDSIAEMRAASPDTEIVVLTMQAETEYAREALRSGAKGYLLKEAADTELVEAVRSAAAGHSYVQPAIGARLAAEAPGVWPPDGLTEREAEVLRLIALGHTNKEIGDQLFLSVRTVESHRARIQQKLGIQSRAELVAYALERRMIGRAATDS